MKRRDAESDHFSHSMTDLMAGVAVIFLLVAAIFMVKAANTSKAEAKRSAQEAEKGRDASRRLNEITSSDKAAIAELAALKDALSASKDLRQLVELVYDADRDPFLLTIVFDRGRLRFDSGDCALRKDTLSVVEDSFGSIFDRICTSATSGFVQSIALEGHTDNRPFFPAERICGVERSLVGCTEKIGSRPDCSAAGFANNVRLSAARAQNVFFQIRSIFAQRPDLIDCLDRWFVISGRGPVEPTDGKAWQLVRSESDNERNRRVVIKVRASSRTKVTAP